MARNENGRVGPGRVEELHIVACFHAPMARVDGRGVCRGREARRSVPVKVPYSRGTFLVLPPAVSGRRRYLVSLVICKPRTGGYEICRRRMWSGRLTKGLDYIQRREVPSPPVFSLQPRYHEGHQVSPSAGPRGW